MLSRVAPFIEPCLPSSAGKPPSSPEWVHEIKHDGYRLMARRDPITIGVPLLTRNGHDWAPRYPLIVEAVQALKVRSCLIDGEAIACDGNGVAVFERLRRKRAGRHVFLLCAFDLLELDGKDLRREPFEICKATLASLLRGRQGQRNRCRSRDFSQPTSVFFVYSRISSLRSTSKRPICPIAHPLIKRRKFQTRNLRARVRARRV